MGKFTEQAKKFEVDLGQLFNRAIRAALIKGLEVAVSQTFQDSSNAAAHWTIKAKGKARTGGRAWQKLRDLRQTKGRKRTPPVGRRRALGIHREEAVTVVRGRELRDVIDKFVAGRKPAVDFSFYIPIDENSNYAKNLKGTLNTAGQAAVDRALDVLNRRIEAGMTRKRRL